MSGSFHPGMEIVGRGQGCPHRRNPSPRSSPAVDGPSHGWGPPVRYFDNVPHELDHAHWPADLIAGWTERIFPGHYDSVGLGRRWSWERGQVCYDDGLQTWHTCQHRAPTHFLFLFVFIHRESLRTPYPIVSGIGPTFISS